MSDMKRTLLFLMGIWMATGLYAQSWLPQRDTMQGEHESMVIDLKLTIDGETYAPEGATSPYRIAAYVDGMFRGESQVNTHMQADGSVALSYFTLTVYGYTDPETKENTLAGKPVTFRIYDEESGLEYILPDTYSYPFADGAHHGTLSDLEELSFTSITGMYLTNEDIYPDTEYNLNDYVTFFSRGEDVTDGTRLYLTWSITKSNTISSYPPAGFHLDASTGNLMVTAEALAGDYEYHAHTQGTTLKEQRGTLTLRKNAASITILNDTVDVLSGTNAFSGVLAEGIDFEILPSDAEKGFFLSYSNGAIVGEDGRLRAGESEVTITASSDESVQGTLHLRVFDDVDEFSTTETLLYLPSTVTDVDAWLKQHITFTPATALHDIFYLSSDWNVISTHGAKPVITGLGETTLTLRPVLTSGDQSITFTIIVYHPIDELVVVKESYDVIVGQSLGDVIYESDATFYFAPQGSSGLPYAYTIEDKEFLTADSCFAKVGSTTMTLWHPARPDLKAQLTLNAYDEATDIEYVGDKVYVPRSTTDLMAYLHKHISLVPATAKQEFKITSSSNATVIGRQATGAPYSVRGYGTAGLLLKPTVTNANRSYLVTVVVYEPVTGINLLVDHLEGTVGENIHSHIAYGATFGFEPRFSRNIITDFTVTPTDPTMIDADGNILRGGPTSVIIASVTNPEVKAELPVTLYDLPEDIDFIDGVERAYIPDTCTDVDAWLKRYIQVLPATAKQEFRYAAASPAAVIQLEGSAPNRYPVVQNTGEGTLIMAPAALPGKIKYFPITVYKPVEEVTILQDTAKAYVGDTFHSHAEYGTHFRFEPEMSGTVRQSVFALGNPAICPAGDINAIPDSEEAQAAVLVSSGTTTVSVSPLTDPGVKGEYTLVVYDYSKEFAHDEKIYIPFDAADPAAYIYRQVSVLPTTARQELEFMYTYNPSVIEVMGGQLHIYGLGETKLHLRSIDGRTVADIPVVVYQEVQEVVTHIDSLELAVGLNLFDYLEAGVHYDVLPGDAPQSIILIPDDTTMVAPDGTILRKGTTLLTLASAFTPEIQSSTPIVVNSYYKLLDFTLSVDGQQYDAPHYFYTHRYEKHTVTLVPQPETAPFDPECLSVGIWDERNFSSGVISSEVVSCTPSYHADGTVKDVTIVIKPQAFGYGDLMIEYSDKRSGFVEKSGFLGFTVCRDIPLEEGWNWTGLFEQIYARYEEEDGELNLDAPTYDHYNDADHFGGGLVDLRLPDGHYLHKDPVYGLFGQIEETWASGAKIHFDRSQATGATFIKDSTILIYRSSYMTSYRGGSADRTPLIHQGWNWIGYPYLYDYSIELLGIRTNDPDSEHAQLYGLPTDGDILLGHDGSMLVYDGTAHEWLTPDGGDYTFRYGQMYLYYTTRPDEPGVDHRFYWGAEAFRYPIYDLTEEASLAPSLRREHSEWTYDSHRFADKMAIIARLDGLDNLEDYSIGAFVGDEGRGEGRAVKDWMFITLSGEAKDHVTFRLLDKRTGLSYPLSESLRFGMLEGTLRDPYRFDTRDIAMGINTIDEAPSLTILDDVVSAHGLIRVYDLQGKLVAEGHDEVSLAPLARGIYIIVTERGKLKVER